MLSSAGCSTDGKLDVKRLPRKSSPINSAAVLMEAYGYGKLRHGRGIAAPHSMDLRGTVGQLGIKP